MISFVSSLVESLSGIKSKPHVMILTILHHFVNKNSQINISF